MRTSLALGIVLLCGCNWPRLCIMGPCGPTLTVRGPMTPHFWGEGRGIRGVRSAEVSENLLTHFSPDRLLEVKLRAIP